jgi:hypothetical protein
MVFMPNKSTQEATVLQLPAPPRTADEAEEQKRVIVIA